jgi:tRNA (guanine-N7-)-methyltransferase
MPGEAPADRPLQGQGAFFGRRKGKTLRRHHGALLAELLPGLRLDLAAPAPADLATLFDPPVGRIVLEIGFGGGEHLALRAAEDPSAGFIGCEAYVNGVAKLLAQVEAGRLANVRLWDDDASMVVDWLPAASLDRVVVLYPDPWPKRRHRKRRLLGEAMLGRLARLLKPGGDLLFATDIDDYSAFVLARAARISGLRWTAERAADWRQPWPGWRSTRYEAKALREGRVPSYLTFRKG